MKTELNYTLNLRHIEDAQREIEDMQAQLAVLKSAIDAKRCTIKEGKRSKARIADPVVKEFIKAMPADSVTVSPSSVGLWLEVWLSPMATALYSEVPVKMGFSLFERRPATDFQNPPMINIFHHPDHKGIVICITTNCR